MGGKILHAIDRYHEWWNKVRVESRGRKLNRNYIAGQVGLAPFDEREELFTRFLLGPETAKHTGRDGYRTGLLYASHGHT